MQSRRGVPDAMDLGILTTGDLGLLSDAKTFSPIEASILFRSSWHELSMSRLIVPWQCTGGGRYFATMTPRC